MIVLARPPPARPTSSMPQPARWRKRWTIPRREPTTSLGTPWLCRGPKSSWRRHTTTPVPTMPARRASSTFSWEVGRECSVNPRQRNSPPAIRPQRSPTQRRRATTTSGPPWLSRGAGRWWEHLTMTPAPSTPVRPTSSMPPRATCLRPSTPPRRQKATCLDTPWPSSGAQWSWGHPGMTRTRPTPAWPTSSTPRRVPCSTRLAIPRPLPLTTLGLRWPFPGARWW